MNLGTFWGAVIVLLPLYYRVDALINTRFVRLHAFLFVTFLSLLLFGVKRVPRLMLYFCISSFIMQYNIHSLTVFTQFLCINAGLVLIAQFSDIDALFYRKTIVKAFGVACLTQSLIMIANYYGYYYQSLFSDFSSSQLIVGTLTQSTLSAALVAITAPALLNKKAWYFLPIPITAVILSGSAMALGSLIVGISSYFLIKFLTFRGRIIIILSGIPLLLLGALSLPSSGFFADTMRFRMWGDLVKFISHPKLLIGYGPGYLSDKFSSTITWTNWKFFHAHNEYLSFLVVFGVIGLIIGIYYILKSIKTNDSIMGAVFFASLANALGNFNFHIVSTAIVGLIAFCYCIMTTTLFKERKNGFSTIKTC